VESIIGSEAAIITTKLLGKISKHGNLHSS
jgi:hypothetical protein